MRSIILVSLLLASSSALALPARCTKYDAVRVGSEEGVDISAYASSYDQHDGFTEFSTIVKDQNTNKQCDDDHEFSTSSKDACGIAVERITLSPIQDCG